MAYDFPQEFLDFRDRIRQIATERIAPRAQEIDHKAEYPWDIRKILGENDVLALPFAETYGGTGTGTLMLQMAVEEIAKADASCALILLVQELGTLPVLMARRSTSPQDARLLELLDSDLSDDAALAECLGLLRAHPALDEARAYVIGRAQEAKKLLTALPAGPARDALEAFADLVATRTA